MKIEQRIWTDQYGWSSKCSPAFQKQSQLVILFGSPPILKNRDFFEEIWHCYPNAIIIGCSTSGEISNNGILDNSLVLSAVIFNKTTLKTAHVRTCDYSNSSDAGEQLMHALDKKGLAHVLILSDGVGVNGSELVRGLIKNLPKGVGLTGGLAGDGDRFQETLVCSNWLPEKGKIVAVGFYGSNLKVGYGCMSGFIPFGPERLVTKATGNILYELDGQSALDLYKTYLGEEKASNLAVNQFYFPLSYKAPGTKDGVIRTILAIDEKQKTMTFAGDILEGGHARLMKANYNQLIDGAAQAATNCLESRKCSQPELALLISCVGRKIVLKQRVEEEIDIVRTILGDKTILTGFYSYGEIGHFSPLDPCQLHNQTMAITTFSEE